MYEEAESRWKPANPDSHRRIAVKLTCVFVYSVS